jgi:hypothetical protein
MPKGTPVVTDLEMQLAWQAEAESLHVFCIRLAADDGWMFFTAPDLRRARAVMGGHPMFATVRAADHDELRLIAVRALAGFY